MSDYEQWFTNQDFYTNMRFIHGDALFTKYGDVYRVLPVQMAYEASFASTCKSIDHIHRLQHEKADQQTKIDELQRENEKLKAEKVALEKLIKEWRKSANWMCATDDKHVINSLRSCADEVERILRGNHE